MSYSCRTIQVGSPQTLDFIGLFYLMTSSSGFSYPKIYTFLRCNKRFYNNLIFGYCKIIMFYIFLYGIHPLAYIWRTGGVNRGVNIFTTINTLVSHNRTSLYRPEVIIYFHLPQFFLLIILSSFGVNFHCSRNILMT